MFHQVQQKREILLALFFLIAHIATNRVLKKGKMKKFKNPFFCLVEDNILTVQKSSTFHCLDPNCVRRCNNKSSGFYLFTNSIWLYCCTVLFDFLFFFSPWYGGGGGYSSEVPDPMKRVCALFVYGCSVLADVSSSAAGEGVGFDGGSRCVSVYVCMCE